jgi:hypothetical protein
MRGNYSFREPLFIDEDGLYITAAQMQFFLNRKDGSKKLSRGDSEFFSYYNNCRTYNLIYDMLDEDGKCAKMYWDHKLESLAFSFPAGGPVALVLANFITVVGDKDQIDDIDDDEDTFGFFN